MQESRGPSHDNSHPDAEQAKAKEEHEQPTVSQPGGFANDPDDPSNPNEVIERTRRHLRP